MPRAGLGTAAVVAAGADLADEIGFSGLTMGQLAERVGVRTPSLYKHVASQDDLHRRIAALALTEAADAIGAATQGRAGRDALRAAARALRDFVVAHPGRYAATIGLRPTGPDDPITAATVMSPMISDPQPRRSSSSLATDWPMRKASSIASPKPVSSSGPKS